MNTAGIFMKRFIYFFFTLLILVPLISCEPAKSSDNTDASVDTGVDGDVSDTADISDITDVIDINDVSDISDITDINDVTDIIDGNVDADSQIDGGTELRDDGLLPGDYYTKAVFSADRTSINSYFSGISYTPPTGSYLLIGKVENTAGYPAVTWFSMGETAFTYSAGNYWPASTVKLAAAVFALQTLGNFGLTALATVSFTDDDGTYVGSVSDLIENAIIISDNVAYNRLMEIAGFTEVNDIYLTSDTGQPQMVLQRRYTHPLPSSDLRHSPEITYSEGSNSGIIPSRVSNQLYSWCTNEANCITLIELADVLRRVVLADDLGIEEIYDLTASDRILLMDSLSASSCKFESAISPLFSSSVEIYNKTGQVSSDDRLDHGYIYDPVSGEEWIVAVSMPYSTTTDTSLGNLVANGITAVRNSTTQSPFLRTNEGPEITVQADFAGLDAEFTVDAPGADSVEIYVDRWFLGNAVPTGAYFTLNHSFSQSGLRQMVVITRAGGSFHSYRILNIQVP
ncbi:class A beta-lactamase-related serine hydrolase [bacterium]|nr:class A beta-lactamase-related serine hydrolase [bacterium]MBU1434678.1 class A beta-lactamase-related serine hydrolase [bacterium]MBU1502665.1 class A beta-lactamase-related serine hydrolase [bacterium]